MFLHNYKNIYIMNLFFLLCFHLSSYLKIGIIIFQGFSEDVYVGEKYIVKENDNVFKNVIYISFHKKYLSSGNHFNFKIN
jgi:hypothetical protein